MHTIALPKVKARRRRLPRPPKFTRQHKIYLLLDTLFGAYSLALFLTGYRPLAGLFGLAAATTGIHSTIMLARDRLIDAMRLSFLSVPLTLAFLAAFFLG